MKWKLEAKKVQENYDPEKIGLGKMRNPMDFTKPVRMGNMMAPPLVDPSRYEILMFNGDRGSGKSLCGEVCLEAFYRSGRVAISLTEAPYSYESMFAAIPRRGKDAIPCIFVVPKGVDVDAPDYDVECITADNGVEWIIRRAIDERRMVIFCHSLWGAEKELESYREMAKWIENIVILQRTVKTPMAILVREIELQGYGRMKSLKSVADLKRALIYLMRLARSSYRMSVITDLQLAQDMDRMLRGQVDKWVIKTHTAEDLPDAMQWLPRRIDDLRFMLKDHPKLRDRLFPELPWLWPSEGYYVLRRKRKFTKIEIPLPSHRHRRQDEDIEDLGVYINWPGMHRVKSPPLLKFKRDWYREGGTTVGMPASEKRELAQAAKAFLESNEDVSIAQLAKTIHLNPGTLWKQMDRYDLMPDREGFAPIDEPSERGRASREMSPRNELKSSNAR